MLLLVVAPLAAAQQDLTLCKAGFSNDDLRVRVESASNAVVTGENEVARRLVKRTQDQLPCLETIVSRPLLGELAWLQAWLSYADQDEARSQRWAQLGQWSRGEGLPEFVPPTHPFVAFVAEHVTPPSPVGDGRPVPPRGGGLFLNGDFLPVARGWADTPGFFQAADETGRVVASSWIEAAAFPEEFVDPPGSAARPPRWWTGEPAPTLAAPAPVRGGGAPVGRLLASGGLALAAGGAYGLAVASTGGLSSADDEVALAGARTRVNVLAMSSAVLAASALGVGATVWLDDGPGLGLAFRF